MSDITESFRNVFISQKNSGYLFELIITKILQNDPHFKQYIINYIDIYKSNIIDLQSFIFEDNFAKIYNEMKSSESIDLEEILILLNRITIVRFENMILDDLYKKYTTDQKSNVEPPQQIDDVRAEREKVERENKERIRTEREKNEREKNEREKKEREKKEREKKEREKKEREKKERENEERENEERENEERENEEREKKEYERPNCDLKHMEKYKSQENNEEELSTVFHHLFSKHAIFQSGRYNYRLNIENATSINLDGINILYNMYNINEYNNKMYLIEQNNKVLITIPVGYYSIEQLLIVMSTLFNNVSINKNKDYKFYATLNKIKNKIFFGCELTEREKFKRNFIFGMSFIYDKYPKNDYCVSSLQDILGFEKSEYINNTTYVTENPPNTCIFEDLYVKVFVNDIELKKYNTSDSSFSYYQCLNLNMDSDFGKVVRFSQDYYPYDIYSKDYIINTISFEFYNSHMNIINIPMRFDTTFSFDYKQIQSN